MKKLKIIVKKNRIKNYLLDKKNDCIKNYNYIYSLYYPIYIIFKNINYQLKKFWFVKFLKKNKNIRWNKLKKEIFLKEEFCSIYFKDNLIKNNINIKIKEKNDLIKWIEIQWIKLYFGRLYYNKIENIDAVVNKNYSLLFMLNKIYNDYKMLMIKFNILKYYYMYIYKKSFINLTYLGLVKNKLKRFGIKSMIKFKKLKVNNKYISIIGYKDNNNKEIWQKNKKWWLDYYPMEKWWLKENVVKE